jgi:hypothetical protein
MRRKRHRPIFVRNCDYCGTQLQTNEPNSDSYVITAESNCEKQPEEIKKEKEIRLKNLKKLEEYQKELKLKQWQKRKENHL